jgi:hypothetical protein
MSLPRGIAVTVTDDNFADIVHELADWLVQPERVIEVKVKTSGLRDQVHILSVSAMRPNPDDPEHYQIVGHTRREDDVVAISLSLGDTVVFQSRTIQRTNATNSVTIKVIK